MGYVQVKKWKYRRNQLTWKWTSRRHKASLGLGLLQPPQARESVVPPVSYKTERKRTRESEQPPLGLTGNWRPGDRASAPPRLPPSPGPPRNQACQEAARPRGGGEERHRPEGPASGAGVRPALNLDGSRHCSRSLGTSTTKAPEPQPLPGQAGGEPGATEQGPPRQGGGCPKDTHPSNPHGETPKAPSTTQSHARQYLSAQIPGTETPDQWPRHNAATLDARRQGHRLPRGEGC